jgi:epoxyqueuosine reductase
VNDLWETIRSELLAGGCSAVGVADVAPFADVRASIEERKAAGMNGSMHFTFGDPERSTDIKQSFPWARSLIVAGRPYLPESGSPAEPKANHGRIARFATADHYVPLREVLGEMADQLVASGFQAEVVVDDNRLVDRAAAVRAGVAWWGKNTMVLAPGAGPWMLLGSIVTDAVLEPTPPMVRDCGTCEACLPACPTGALIEPGILDARRCLAHLLQAPGWLPAEFRAAVGDRIYGCDDCLDACPPGGHLEATAPLVPRVDLLSLLALTDEALLGQFDHFYVPRRRAAFLRRNILVALGNSGDSRAVEPVAAYLRHPDPMLRAHAAWALGAIGGRDTDAVLERASQVEPDGEVMAEIVEARRNSA